MLICPGPGNVVAIRIASPESEKDGEPRNYVPEEGFKSEEGCYEIFNILVIFFRIYHLGLSYAR